jgi:hypothetical protein
MIFCGLQGYVSFLQPYPAKFNEHIIDQVVFEDENVIGSDLLHQDKYDSITEGNRILIFNNDMPNDDELYEIETEEQLREKFGDNIIFDFEIDLRNIYDMNTLTRKIYKNIPDSFKIEALKDGDAKWFAIILTPYDETLETDGKDYILFFDSIGLWDENKVMTLEKTTNLSQGERILFKDFSFEIREKLIYFGV